MVSSVNSRPSHYETLGLKPTASSDEIAQAFALAISLFRPRAFGDVAQVSSAFETLRDPLKRRAYDASIGLKPEPEPLHSWARPVGAHFIDSVSASPVQRDDTKTPPIPALQADPEPTPELKMASFIAASLPDPVIPEAPSSTSPGGSMDPEPPRKPEPDAKPSIEPRTGGERELHRLHEMQFDEVRSRPNDWKRTGIAAGVLIAAAAVPGALLGLLSGNGGEPAQPAPSKTIALPAAKPPMSIDAAALFAADEALPRQPKRIDRARSTRPATLPRARQAEASQADELAPLPENPSEQAVAEAPAVEPVAANMPLPNRVIARTIGRIGYACGEIASTAAVEGGAPGVFKVTCTSGHSYQATPVRGRYRFRRLDSR